MGNGNNILTSDQEAAVLAAGEDPGVAAEKLNEIRELVNAGLTPDDPFFGTDPGAGAAHREAAQNILIDEPWMTEIVKLDPKLSPLEIVTILPGQLESLAFTFASPSIIAAGIANLATAGATALTSDKTFDDVIKETVREEFLAEQRQKDASEAESEELTNPILLAARYRFAEQCYLVYNMTELAALHKASQINPDGAGVLPKYKYNKTHLLEGNGSMLLNKLRARPGSEGLLDASPADLSALVPMIKLFKVVYSQEPNNSGEIDYEIPIRFLNHTLTEDFNKDQNVESYLQPGSGRTGVGIRSFDWEYISTNPDTVRNDITAKLVLFFQNFDDLAIYRKANLAEHDDAVPYRYLDLIVHPPAPGPPATNEDDVPDDIGCGSSADQFDSSFFEIRAVVGWASEGTSAEEGVASSVGYNQTNLFLTLQDHSFNIEQDGTFSLTIEYRGRLDGMLTSPKANVLLTGGGAGAFGKKAWQALVGVNQSIAELKKDKICADQASHKKKLKGLKEQKVLAEDELRTLSYKGFANNLMEPTPFYAGYPQTKDVNEFGVPLIYSAPISWDEIRTFIDRNTDPAGELELKAITSDIEGISTGAMAAGVEEDAETATITADGAEFKVSGGTFSAKLEDYHLLDDLDPQSNDTLLQFFFLGDLIDLVATIVLNNTKAGVRATLGSDDLNQNEEFIEKYCFNKSEVENTRILLGPLEYTDPQTQEVIRINIGDIPISFRMFIDFCHRKIVKPRKQTYALIDFIRDMIKDLVIRALGADCFGEQGNKGVRIRVGFVEGPALEEGGDPIVGKAVLEHFLEEEAAAMSSAPSPTESTVRLNMNAVGYYNPIFNYQGKTDTKNTFQYIVIYTEGPSGLVHPSFEADEPISAAIIDRTTRGIHHLHIGRDRGLVKTIQFSKTDAPYLREARVEKRTTFDPILQLSDVYEVTIKMFGNVFFYPGSYTYINPFGLGSTHSLGFPWKRGTLSNIMGLGGYHIIINVANYIENGVFETTIKARFDCSGDGCRVTSAQEEKDSICAEEPASTVVPEVP